MWAKAWVYSARAGSPILAWSPGQGSGWSGCYKLRWFLEIGWRQWLTCQLFYWGGWPRLSAGDHFSLHDGLFTILVPPSLATSSESLLYITWPITPRWPFSHLNQIISTLCLISVAKSSAVLHGLWKQYITLGVLLNGQTGCHKAVFGK